ncbi:MAG: hypothetical protein E3J66_04575 [Dehalococcoidia bacterium]|nr:MAG: hypothetical protein E3J66_04575 [Dehalococcoidia bacterium]
MSLPATMKICEDTVKRYLTEILVKLQQAQVLEEATVVLLGSIARGKQTWRSDIDFLVITPVYVRHWRVPINVHVHLETREVFLKKLNQGNDFQGWAVRFGKVCADASGWWTQVLADKGRQAWPDWRLKVQHARKRQSVASRLLADGDGDGAEEEYLMVAAHIARALLLRSHVFPLSRPELPAQLVEIGLREDARSVERLMNGTNDLDELRQIAAFVEQRLNELEQVATASDAQGKPTMKKLTGQQLPRLFNQGIKAV